MCIIQGVIEKVSDTRIMAAPIQRRKKRYQLTVYENKVGFGAAANKETTADAPWMSSFFAPLTGPTQVEPTEPDPAPVAMILPFPNGETCNLIDLSDYPDIFDDLGKVMKEPMLSAMNGAYWCKADANHLEVHQVGSYKVSVAPSLAKLSQLDFGLFNLDPEVQGVLEGNYPAHFGFVVCMMDQGADFHPIAYIHQVKEKLFIPTYHFHDHGDGGNHETADWDHEIYIMNPHRKAMRPMESPGLTVEYGTAATMKRLARHVDFNRIPYAEIGDFKDIVCCKIDDRFSQNVDFVIPINLNN